MQIRVVRGIAFVLQCFGKCDRAAQSGLVLGIGVICLPLRSKVGQNLLFRGRGRVAPYLLRSDLAI